MSEKAHHVKKGQYIVLDGKVHYVVGKGETSGAHVAHNVHLTLQEFLTDHRTDKTFSHDHHLPLATESHHKYSLTHLLDETDGALFLSLVSDDGTNREDLSEHNSEVKAYLKKHFESEDAEALEVTVTKVHADNPHSHSNDPDICLERLTRVQGLDMKHLHDHNHHHHHEHKAHA